jgi:mannose-6-phosphate isomerase-like protein (cupin superfamily)
MDAATILVSAIKKSSQAPDETRSFPNGKVEIFHLQDRDVAVATLKPGWKYSVDVGPLDKTARCSASHLQYVISGRLLVETEDGAKLELGPGDFASIPPGHDAWVLGNEPFVAIDFLGMRQYAKAQTQEDPAYEPFFDEIVGFD